MQMPKLSLPSPSGGRTESGPVGGRAAYHPPPPKKSLGQHFLVDRRVLRRIIDAAELTGEDFVVEVGPGRGLLTGALLDAAGQVVAVELDRALAEALSEKFVGTANLRVVEADARHADIDSLVAVDTPYKVVANLPYYAASPIVRRFLEAARKPRLMVVMMQREVAQNIVAPPGKKGLLSIAIQLYGKPRIVGTVPPRAFRPVPKVTSAILRIDVYPEPALTLDSTERFFTVVRAAFSAPRKQLRNSLSHGLAISTAVAEDLLSRADVDPKRRAQTLSLPEWGSLYESFRAMPHLSKMFTSGA